MALNITAIALNQIKNARTGQTVSVNSLWADQTAVVVLFRRWGCLLCRVWAKQLSDLYPALKENNIRLIGIGVDEIGLDDFLKGEYFPGDLYIDSSKSIYSGLGLKRFSYFTILTSLMTSESRSAISQGRAAQLGGDFKGDGLQNGGAFVVKKGGEVLFSFRQERPAEHISNEKFAEILKIKYTPSGNSKDQPATCDSEACSR